MQADYTRAEGFTKRWITDPQDSAAQQSAQQILADIAPILDNCRQQLTAKAEKLSDEVDELPWSVRHGLPRYPDKAREAGLEGDVMVEVIVGADGCVVTARALSGPDTFHASACDAIRRTLFLPAGRLTPSSATGHLCQSSLRK